MRVPTSSFLVFLFLAVSWLNPSAEAQSCINSSQIDPNAACYMIYAPVCGCDGITYPNDCVAFYYAGLVQWTPGDCGNGCHIQIDYQTFQDSTTGLWTLHLSVLGALSIDSLVWTFPDGSTSTHQNPSTTLTSAGIYQVCVEIYDSASSCSGQMFCELIDLGHGFCVDPTLINPMVMCPEVYDPVCGCDGNTYSNACEAMYLHGIINHLPGTCASLVCDPSFYYYIDSFDTSGYQIRFFSYNQQPDSILWDFGNGRTSSQTYPSLWISQGSLPDSMIVCLTIGDTTAGCLESRCEMIWLDTLSHNDCSMAFDWYVEPDALGDDSSIVLNAPTSEGIQIHWIMPDGSVLENNPSDSMRFVPDTAGVYVFCISLWDSIQQCGTYWCDSIQFRTTGSRPPKAQNILPFRAHPNPFQHATEISWQTAQDGFWTLFITDINGRKVADVMGAYLPAGHQQFTLKSLSLSPGIYLLHAHSTKQQEILRLVHW